MSVCSPYRSLTDTKSLLASGEEEDKRGEEEDKRGEDKRGEAEIEPATLSWCRAALLQKGGVYEGRLCPYCSAVVLKAVLTVVKQQQRQKKEIGIFFL